MTMQLCTELEARMFREAASVSVNRLNRMSKAALAAEHTAILADQGMTSVYGGPRSKDELISAIMNLRYPVARLNMTTHVLYHQLPSEVCEWCVGPLPCGNCGATAAERCKSWCGAAESRCQPETAQS